MGQGQVSLREGGEVQRADQDRNTAQSAGDVVKCSEEDRALDWGGTLSRISRAVSHLSGCLSSILPWL